MFGIGPFSIPPPTGASGTQTGGAFNPSTPYTSNTTLSRALSQNAPVDSTSGTFTLTLPVSTSAQVGDVVRIPDWGKDVATNNVTIAGNGYNVQNQHTGAISASSYAFGSNEASGAALVLELAFSANTTPTHYWKVDVA